MKSKYIKIFAFILILTFYATLLTHKVKLPLADDMARHITNGKLIMAGEFDVIYKNVYSYTDAGHPFVNHHWLSGVVYYLFFQVIGWNGLVILKVITYLLAFSLIFLSALRKADFWLVSVLSIPSIFIIMERMSLRPEMFSYLFIAFYVYFLLRYQDKPESNKIFWLIPIQLLWVNMHIFWSIGIMIVGAFLFEKIIENRKNLRQSIIVKKLAIVLLVMSAVVFINPNGVKGVFYRYPSDFPVKIAENNSLLEYKKYNAPNEDWSVTLFVPIVIFTLISLYFGVRNRKLSIFYILGTLATMAMGFFILRGVYFFGLFFLLSVSASLNDNWLVSKQYLYDKFNINRKYIVIIFSIIFLSIFSYLIYLGLNKKLTPYTETGVGLASRSMESAKFFITNKLKGPIFNDADSGSYLIFNLYPKEKVFVDNLFADAYSAEVFSEHTAMIEDEGKWREGLDKYDFNVIFFYQYNGGVGIRRFLYNRMNDPEWAFVHADTFNYIFLRRNLENENVIRNYEITKENIADRLYHLSSSESYDDRVSFADIANLMGRQDLGMQTFVKILAKWPERGKMWMIMGEWELSENNPKSPLLAAMYLEKAISLGHKTSEAYAFLGASYAKAGQIERSKENLRKAIEINPNRQDAVGLLSELENR